MKITLTAVEKTELETKHKTEPDRRVADRIKAVVLNAQGWTQTLIAQALLISPETVHDHLQDYINSNKLKPENGGSDPKLNQTQTTKLITHLENRTYTKVSAICAWVYRSFGVTYTVAGMTKWLAAHNFSYKKPKGTPAKANTEEQEKFIETYLELVTTTPKDEPILFGDGVHPTMATKITYGWIRKGTDKPIATTASRTRMNLMGSINLQTMSITVGSHETINSDAMDKHFAALKEAYTTAVKIHLILDRGSYNTSAQTRASAEKYGIVLHYLPAYSPNLNPIERVWKVMNERVRNNRVFTSAKEFRHDILAFFDTTWSKISNTLRSRINDNFQTLKSVSSG